MRCNIVFAMQELQMVQQTVFSLKRCMKKAQHIDILCFAKLPLAATNPSSKPLNTYPVPLVQKFLCLASDKISKLS